VDRLVCLELRAFPLQLLLRANAGWRGEPAAVLERDAPHGLVLWVNEAARAAGVLPGQRYGAALGLCARLRAGTLAPGEIERGVGELVRELQRFSPEVEASAEEPGLFWLAYHGLERLFGTPRAWASAILARVVELGFEGRGAVGFRHFGVYAGAKGLARTTLVVFEDRAHEARALAEVELARLPLDPETRAELAKLAITTLGAFVRLPAGGIRQRFGEGAHRLHGLAASVRDDELDAAEEPVPLEAHVDLDLPEESLDALLARVEELTRSLCATLERSGEGASTVHLRLGLDDGSACEESIVPARATRDVAWMMRLLAMRLDGRVLARGAIRIEVCLERVPLRAEQATLFARAKQRSHREAATAFSALRAAFGEGVVARASLVSAHLPEFSFHWARCDQLAHAAPRSPASRRIYRAPLVRCFFESPLALPPRGRHEPDGWMLRGVTHGSVARLIGRYRVNGGWWGGEVEREYSFAELTSGQIAWVFYDVVRRRWFLQGYVA
jgi:protein ImuB